MIALLPKAVWHVHSSLDNISGKVILKAQSFIWYTIQIWDKQWISNSHLRGVLIVLFFMVNIRVGKTSKSTWLWLLTVMGKYAMPTLGAYADIFIWQVIWIEGVHSSPRKASDPRTATITGFTDACTNPSMAPHVLTHKDCRPWDPLSAFQYIHTFAFVRHPQKV